MKVSTLTPSQNGWIFGPRVDLIVFPLSTLLALGAGLMWPEAQMGFISFVLIEEMHSFMTYFFTFGSKKQIQQHGKRIFTYLFLALAIFGGMYFWFGKSITLRVFVLANLYHFARQQSAWFTISSSRFAISQVESIVNRAAIWASNWGVVLIYMAADNRDGWYIQGDLWHLPHWFQQPLIVVTCAALAIYVLFHAGKFFFHGTPVRWVQHMMLANSLIIWSVGLLLYIPYVIAAAHTIPYIYLSLSYMRERKIDGEQFFPQFLAMRSLLIFVFAGAVSVAIAEWFTRGWIFWFWAALAVTHYLIDGFFWRRRDNPEGREFLNRQAA